MAFPNNCNPRIINVDASCGCALTRANIRGMTPQDFEDQGFKEIGMDRIITRAREARVAGVQESTLESLLMSRMANIKAKLSTSKISPSESVILPFIYMRQKRNINSNYWRVEAGAATPGAGAGGIPASAWDLTLRNTSSPYASALVGLEKYFLPGKHLVVEYVNTTTLVAYTIQYKIIAAVNANAGGIEKAKVTLEPNLSPAGWTAASAGVKLTYQPTGGTAFILANSISDYESWCFNEVAENPNKLLTFWLQTTRETHCFNDEYLKALNAALTSGYYKDFRQLPLAEQKRIQHIKFRRDWLNSVFYGQRLTEAQASPETYTTLPQVVDPANPTCVLEYKANSLGVKTQLQDCLRYLDHQGNPLNLDNLASILYDVKRAREASGGTIDRIDIGTDRFTAGAILQMMTTFYKAKYGIDTTRFYQPDQALKFDNQVMLKYNVYQLPADLGGMEMAVYTDTYFDDKLSAFETAQKNRGRTVWIIDWSDVTIGVAATASATRQTNVADNLYNCIIRPNINHYQLQSTMWTTIVEDPSRHYVIDNFSDSCPTLTVAGCTV